MAGEAPCGLWGAGCTDTSGCIAYLPMRSAARRLDHRLRVVVALILEVEEVHAGGGAVQEHLREGEGGPEVDALAVEACRVRVEDAIAPRHEVEVVAEPAEQRLEGVAVRVHRAGQEERAGKASGSAGIRAWGERGDAPVAHVHGD